MAMKTTKYWTLAKFNSGASFKGKGKSAVKIKVVKSKKKPRKGAYQIVYGPFDSKQTASDYLSYHGIKVDSGKKAPPDTSEGVRKSVEPE